MNFDFADFMNFSKASIINPDFVGNLKINSLKVIKNIISSAL